MPTVSEVSPPASQAQSSDVGRRYVRAALHTGVGGMAGRVLTGLAPVILARYLGPKEFGVYTLVLSLVGIVAGVSHLGQNKALQKFLPEYCVKDPSRGGAILADTVVLVSGTLLAVCILFFFLSGWIASAIYRQASLTPVFQFSALLILSLSLFNLASSAIAGLQDFKAYSKAMVVRSAGFLVLAWAGVWALGLYGALGGQLLAAVLGVAYLTLTGIKVTRRRFPRMVRVLFSRDILAEIFSFAFPAFLSGMLVAPAYWWADTLLARHSGFEQVGLFGVAFAFSQLIMVIPGSLSIPAVSFMSETYASSQAEKFSKLVSTNVRLIWAITLPISLGCALFAPWIVKIAFGPAYRDASPLAFIMSFVVLAMAINGVIGNAIAGSGRMWHAFALNGFWLVIFVVAALLLIPELGSTGLAATFAVSYSLFGFGVWFYSRRFIGIAFDGLFKLLGLTLATVALSAFIFSLGNGPRKFAVAAVLLLGLVTVELRWALTTRERSIVRNLLSWSLQKNSHQPVGR